MIITYIFLGLVILPIILCVIDCVFCSFDHDSIISAFAELFGALWAITIPCLVICVGLILNANLNADVKYENKVFERAAIVQTYEDVVHSNEIVSVSTNGEYYQQIIDFNNSLRAPKKWAGNPWVNWFVVEELAEIDYIDLPELNND